MVEVGPSSSVLGQDIVNLNAEINQCMRSIIFYVYWNNLKTKSSWQYHCKTTVSFRLESKNVKEKCGEAFRSLVEY